MTRQRKRYGNVKARAVRVRKWTPNDRPAQSYRYLVSAGTLCERRKHGTKKWQAWIIPEDAVVTGFLWRNRGWYGFLHNGIELKVAVGMFRQMD
jgi:hypothetical protein